MSPPTVLISTLITSVPTVTGVPVGCAAGGEAWGALTVGAAGAGAAGLAVGVGKVPCARLGGGTGCGRCACQAW